MASIFAAMSVITQITLDVAVSMVYMGWSVVLQPLPSSSSPAIAEKRFLASLACMNWAVVLSTLYRQAISSVGLGSRMRLAYVENMIELPTIQKRQTIREEVVETGEAAPAVESPATPAIEGSAAPAIESPAANTQEEVAVPVQETSPVKSNEDTVEAINPVPNTPALNQRSTALSDNERPLQGRIRNSLLEELDSLCIAPSALPTAANNEEKMLSRDIEEKITVEVARIIEAQRVKVEQCVVKFTNRPESQKGKEAGKEARTQTPVSPVKETPAPEVEAPKPVVVNIELAEAEDQSECEETTREPPPTRVQTFEPEKHLDNTSQDSFDSSAYDSESEADRSAGGSPLVSPVSSVCGDTDVWTDTKTLEAVPADLDTRVLGESEALAETPEKKSMEQELREDLEDVLLSRVKETPSRPVSRDGPRMFFRSKSTSSSIYSQPSRKPSTERFQKPSVEAPKPAFTLPPSILDRPLPPLPKSEVLVQQQPAVVEKSMAYAPFQTWSKAVAKTIERKSLIAPKRTIVSVAKKLQRAPKKKVPLKARLSSSSKRNFLSKPFW